MIFLSEQSWNDERGTIMRRTRSIIMASVSLLLAASPQVGAAGPAADCAQAAPAANIAVERGAVVQADSAARGTAPNQSERHRIFSGTTGDTVHLPGSRYCRGSCDAPTVAVGTSSAAGLRGSYPIPAETAAAAAKEKCQAAPRAKE